jgi:hypothetical protein
VGCYTRVAMCTLVVIVPEPGGLLEVAANRDEFLARPASPPARWPGDPAVLAPRDEQAGGTWLGVNAARMFVGVTNRHGAGRDPTRASRGQLVADALRAPSVDALHARLASLGAAEHNPFHLLYADAEGRAGLTWNDGREVHQRQLVPGLHVLTERSLGAGDEASRVTRVAAAVAGVARPVALETWAALLRTHTPDDPREGLCLHLPAFGYGTRSSFLLRLGPPGAASWCAWTEGPPCTHPWVEGSAVLGEVIA